MSQHTCAAPGDWIRAVMDRMRHSHRPPPIVHFVLYQESETQALWPMQCRKSGLEEQLDIYSEEPSQKED
jgi:hypothetical protein